MLLHAPSLAGTHSIAATLASFVRAGDIIVLAGEMGAGKTAFAQGFGRALGVLEPITSPTFTLVHSYECANKLTMYHADLYRLDHTSEIEELALHELAEFGGVVLVEWGDVAAAGLADHLEVRLMRDDENDGVEEHDETVVLDGPRVIELHVSGSGWSGRWDRMRSDLAVYEC